MIQVEISRMELLLRIQSGYLQPTPEIRAASPSHFTLMRKGNYVDNSNYLDLGMGMVGNTCST